MFIFFIIFIILGLGVCFFIYHNSKDEINELLGLSSKDDLHVSEDQMIEKDSVVDKPRLDEKTRFNKFSTKEFINNLIQKILFWKKAEQTDGLDTVSMPSLQDVLATENNDFEDSSIPGEQETSTGTASLKINLPVDEESLNIDGVGMNVEGQAKDDNGQGEIGINEEPPHLQHSITGENPILHDSHEEINSSAPVLSSKEGDGSKDIEERYKKLDDLFTEKTEELAIVKRQLENEIKNRQEFEKIKELMQKEIEALKEKVRSLREQLDKIHEEKDKSTQESQTEKKSQQLSDDII